MEGKSVPGGLYGALIVRYAYKEPEGEEQRFCIKALARGRS